MAAAGSAFEHTVDMGISCSAFNRAWLALTAVSEVEAMLFITGCLPGHVRPN